MDSRVTSLEALIPTLATKQDLSDLECRMHKEIATLGWRLVSWTSGVLITSFAGVFYIARHVH